MGPHRFAFGLHSDPGPARKDHDPIGCEPYRPMGNVNSPTLERMDPPVSLRAIAENDDTARLSLR
jgi:hypothetical protein